MRCAVKNCNNDNNSKASSISFFSFPSNAVLQKQWVRFCCRNKNFNHKTSVICMEHFKPDEFTNKLQYDMGFTKRRLLNHGAVPSIKKQSAKSERLFKERKQRIERRENKKTVQRLIKEYETISTLVEATSNATPENLLKHHIHASHNVTRDDEVTYEITEYLEVGIKCEDEYLETEQIFQCGQCVQNFKNETNLKLHMLSHTGEHFYSCEMCGKQISSKSLLRNHKEVYNNDLALRCDTCSKEFKIHIFYK